MRLWLDCEWNDFRGQLISMALVDENGREWYENVLCEKPRQWVAQNVIPVLNKAPLPNYQELQCSLALFMKEYDSAEIIADWPEDIARFCDALISGPGTWTNGFCGKTTNYSFRIDRRLWNAKSEIPHNALSDARANRIESIRLDRLV